MLPLVKVEFDLPSCHWIFLFGFPFLLPLFFPPCFSSLLPVFPYFIFAYSLGQQMLIACLQETGTGFVGLEVCRSRETLL